VYTPTLTGLAERAAELSPDIGLETHIQDVVGLLVEKNLQGVILVGHSYGGMVITGVVDAVPERIAHLVYLDTFVPRDGESLADVSPMRPLCRPRELSLPADSAVPHHDHPQALPGRPRTSGAGDGKDAVSLPHVVPLQNILWNQPFIQDGECSMDVPSVSRP
jgi:pimeloyl-ACP methyl ester carboxylesterase